MVYEKVNKYLKPTIPKSYIRKNNKKIVVPLKKFDGNEGLLFHDDTVHFGPKIIHQIVDYQLNLIY